MSTPTRRGPQRVTCPACGKATHLSWRESVTVVGQHWPPGTGQASPFGTGPVGAPCEGTGVPVTDEQIYDARRERHRTGAMPVVVVTRRGSESS